MADVGVSQNQETLQQKFLAILQFIFELFVGTFLAAVDTLTNKKKDVRGKIVVITGSAHGIGAEMSKIFSELGAKVAMIDFNYSKNESTAAEINAEGGEAYAFTCDVTKFDDVKVVVEKIVDHQDLGKPDIVICNAGILHSPKDFVDLTEAEIRQSIDVNVLGVFWTAKAFLPGMIEDNRGHLVAVSSVAGYFGESYSSIYSASKFALRGLMESLHWEMQDSGKGNVKMTTVYPYFTKTGLISECNIQTRFFDVLECKETAAQIVDAILYERREAWIPGHISFTCNILKGIMTYRGVDAMRRMLAVKYK